MSRWRLRGGTATGAHSPPVRVARATIAWVLSGGAWVGAAAAADPGAPPAADSIAQLDSGYAVCKQIVAAIFPHPPGGIQASWAQGSYHRSSDGRTHSYTGFVRGPTSSAVDQRPYVFRNFQCTLSLDPDSASGWTLDGFRWLDYR